MEEQQIRQESYATEISQLSDLKNYIGKELGVSEWTTISQNQIDTFARTTDDNQWIHVNPELAKKHSPYKKPIAHGFLILSLASKFCYETVKLLDVGMGVNYGLDKVRFMNATPVGSLVRARVSLISTEDVTGGLRYKMKLVFELKGQEKPACVAEFIALAYVDASKKNKKSISTENSENLDELRSKSVLFKKEGDIAIVTLNRPEKYNAVNDDLVNGINESIAKVQKDDSIRAMVITGAGKGFCSGADMNTFGNITPDEGRTYLTNTYGPLMRNLTTLKKPIIAAINGTAAGVGASIALACDFRVMSENSGLLYAFINIGLGPDGGASWLLARQVGYSRALQIAVEGKKIKGTECHRLGLANKLVENDAIVSTAIHWAHQIAKLPTLAVGITKEDIFHAMDNDLQSTIAYEAERQTAAFASHDLVEGVSAFLQKRKPKFIGK
jgi:enoyl-CoA hydratase/carnithine racemase/acyl dehydratase